MRVIRWGTTLVAVLLMASFDVAIAQTQTATPEDISRRVIAAIGAGDQAALLQALPDKEALNARLSTGDTPLVAAAALGRTPIVQTLIEHGATLDGTSQRGWTPLMTLVFFGNREIADLLLQRGAKKDISGSDGATARSIALWRGYADLVARFPAADRKPTEADLIAAVVTGDHTGLDALLAAHIRPTAADATGNPAIVIAAAADDLGAIERLLRAGAPVDAAGPSGVTALMVAVQQNRADAVKTLLDAGANPQLLASKGVSPISLAEGLGYGQIVQLLRSKAHDGGSDETKTTELAAAAAADDDLLAASLLAHGANIDGSLVKGKQVVPLSAAAFYGATKTVTLLLDKGAEVGRSDDNGNTPLMAAIVGHQTKIAALLIQHGASWTVTNKAGISPLTMARAANWTVLGTIELYNQEDFVDAVKRGDARTVHEMLDRHDIWATQDDQRGWSPIMYAAQAGSLDVVEALIQYGATAELSDLAVTVPSPLMIAAANGKGEVVDFLLLQGADPTRHDGAGQTAADMARKKGFTTVSAKLLAAGKAYAKKINAALAELGCLDKPDDSWGDRNRKALESFYDEFRFLSSYAAPIALDKALKRTLRVCNGTDSTIQVVAVFHPNETSYKQNVTGWWNIDPGACKWLYRTKFGSDTISGPGIWVRAERGDAWWGGDRTLCLPKEYSRMNDYVAEQQDNCPTFARAAKFYRIIPYSSPNPYIFKPSSK